MSFFIFVAALVLLGMFVQYLAHAMFQRKVRGRSRARYTVLLMMSMGVLPFFALSLLLLFNVYGFAGRPGPDWLLNSGIPFLNFTLNPSLQVPIAILMAVVYPLSYLAGARLAELIFGLGFPSLREPISLDPGESIVVVADTHLGLKPSALHRLMAQIGEEAGPEWEPSVIGSFLEWLKRTPVTRPVWDEANKKVIHPPIHRPGYLVLLGDVLELWDAPDESVQVALASTFSKLGGLTDTKVIYVLGNHDGLLERDRTLSPVEGTEMRIAADVWPGPHASESSDLDPYEMQPIRAGKRDYLFLHGHQFDRAFQFFGSLSSAPGHLRRAARLGNYGWLFLLFFGVTLYFWWVGAFAASVPLAALVTALLFLLGFPVLYMSLARWVFRRLTGLRYKPTKALKGFLTWWRGRVAGGRPSPRSKARLKELTVVYGHTHEANVVDQKRMRTVYKLKRAQGEPPLPLLLNVPAWIKDPRHAIERAIFLYLDETGYRFYGWDWVGPNGKVRPFHIPTGMVSALRDGVPLDKARTLVGIEKEETLDELGWPAKFKAKWKKGDFHGVLAQPLEE